jgi:dipeptidase E
MHLYLSSFRVGGRADELRSLAAGRPIGFVPNALDHVARDARAESNTRSLTDVRGVGLDVRPVDLRDYFGDPRALRAALAPLGGVWVRGGNTFVLRQAMRLSGFDAVLRELTASDFLYGGYSAGICVLAPSLDGLQHVDDPTARPYVESEVVWDGVGLLPYLVLPHYKSDHPESAAIDREVEYCTANGIPFRTLRDGEVIVMKDVDPTVVA